MASGAVVKANYTRDAARAVASARYYASRTNAAGERELRPAFSRDADALGPGEVREALRLSGDPAPYFYRVVLSPSADASFAGDLRVWVRDVLADFRAERPDVVTWLAFEHAGEGAHTGHPHAHLVLVTRERLGRGDLGALRERATLAWDAQREHHAEVSLDPLRDAGLERGLGRADGLTWETSR